MAENCIEWALESHILKFDLQGPSDSSANGTQHQRHGAHDGKALKLQCKVSRLTAIGISQLISLLSVMGRAIANR